MQTTGHINERRFQRWQMVVGCFLVNQAGYKKIPLLNFRSGIFNSIKPFLIRHGVKG
jgi:hypothetical protein